MIKLHEVQFEQPDRELWVNPSSVSLMRTRHMVNNGEVTEIYVNGFFVTVSEPPQQIQRLITEASK